MLLNIEKSGEYDKELLVNMAPVFTMVYDSRTISHEAECTRFNSSSKSINALNSLSYNLKREIF